MPERGERAWGSNFCCRMNTAKCGHEAKINCSLGPPLISPSVAFVHLSSPPITPRLDRSIVCVHVVSLLLLLHGCVCLRICMRLLWELPPFLLMQGRSNGTPI